MQSRICRMRSQSTNRTQQRFKNFTSLTTSVKLNLPNQHGTQYVVVDLHVARAGWTTNRRNAQICRSQVQQAHCYTCSSRSVPGARVSRTLTRKKPVERYSPRCACITVRVCRGVKGLNLSMFVFGYRSLMPLRKSLHRCASRISTSLADCIWRICRLRLQAINCGDWPT